MQKAGFRSELHVPRTFPTPPMHPQLLKSLRASQESDDLVGGWQKSSRTSSGSGEGRSMTEDREPSAASGALPSSIHRFGEVSRCATRSTSPFSPAQIDALPLFSNVLLPGQGHCQPLLKPKLRCDPPHPEPLLTPQVRPAVESGYWTRRDGDFRHT